MGGCNYPTNNKKLLLVGESHYLKETSDYHHDPERWYAGVSVSDKDDWGWIKTRNIISNGIQTKWGDRSKAIYRNIEKALFESLMFEKKPLSAFTEVAFMNYFQRPAERTGKSIKVSQRDAEVSYAVFQSVINAIAPNIIIFTSSLAWQHARKSEAKMFLDKRGVSYARAPSSWNAVVEQSFKSL